MIDHYFLVAVNVVEDVFYFSYFVLAVDAVEDAVDVVNL